MWSGVRTLCIAILLSCLSANHAQADCPAAPLETATDLVVSFLTDSTTQAGPATLFASTVEKGMLVYDGNANALKFCDGANWLTLADTGGAGANAAGPAGYVQISDGSGGLTYSGSTAGQEFFWDNTNKRLGIGTAAPAVSLHAQNAAATNYIFAESTAANSSVGFVMKNDARQWNMYVAGATSDSFILTDATESAARLAVDASGNVGIGTVSPNASALLDLTTTTKGFLPPRMTEAQRDAITSPATGLVVYNTDTDALNYYDGDSWEVVGTGAGGGPSVYFHVKGEANKGGGTLKSFPTVVSNEGGAYNNATGVFTAPKTGVYFFNASVLPTGASTITLYLRKNGTNLQSSYAHTGEFEQLQVSSIAHMSAGDTVDVVVSGAGLHTNSWDSFYGSIIEGGSGGGGATTLAGLTDVDLTGLADGNTLVWNSSTNSWEPGTAASGGGSGMTFQTASIALLTNITLAGSTPTYTPAIPITLPDGTWAVLLNVLYDHNSSTATHGYLSFKAYQTGTTEEEYKTTYISRHFNDYANSDWVQILVPWRQALGLNSTITIEVTSSHNSDTLNRYHIYYGGYIAGGSGGGGGSTTLAGLTDVALTGLADGNTLVWNNSTSKWEAGSAASGGPVVSFYVTRDAGTTSNGAAILFNQERVDTDNAYNPATGIFTAPSAGLYQFSFGGLGGATNDTYYLNLYKNGGPANVATVRIDTTATGSEYGSGSGTGYLNLAQGDTVHVRFSSTLGSALYGSSNYLYFGGHLLSTGGGGGGGSSQWADVTGGLSYASGGAAVGVGTLNASAILQADSTTKGFLPPRMTTAQRNAIASPATGLTIFNTTTGAINYYNGSAWTIVGTTDALTTGSSSGGGTTAAAVTNAGWQNFPNAPTISLPSAGTYFITSHVYYTYSSGCADVYMNWAGADLSYKSRDGKWQACGADGTNHWTMYGHVVVVSASTTLNAQYNWTNAGTAGQVQFSSASFIKLNTGSGGGGGGGSTTLAGLTDVDLSALADGKVLTYDNGTGKWVAADGGGSVADGDKGDIVVSNSGADWTIDTASIVGSKIANGAIGASHIANGSISGSKIAIGAIGASHVEIGAIDASRIADAAISGSKIANGAVTFVKLQNIASGMLLGRSTADNGSVEEISVGSGLNLSGGVLSASGGGSIADGDKGDIVVSNSGADWTIDTASIVGSKIAFGAIGASHIADGSIGATKIMNGAIGASHIEIGAIDASRIADAAISGSKIANGAVTFVKLQNIASGMLLGRSTADNGSVEEISVGSGLNLSGGVLSASGGGSIADGDKGDIVVSNSGADWTIDTASIVGSKIANGAIGASHIANGSISGSKIAIGAIGASHVEIGAIDASRIADAAISGSKIANGAIGASHIANGSISGSKIAIGAIGASHVEIGAIDASRIADAAISGSKIANGAVTFVKLQNIASGMLLGRSTADNGSVEEISVGSGLSLSGGVLSASGGAAAGDGGQIQFNDGSDAFAADASLHWDNTNKRLGIGTNSPGTKLEVSGGNNAPHLTLGPDGGRQVSFVTSAVSTYDDALMSIVSNSLVGSFAFKNSNGELLRVTHGGNVGIGTTSPQAKLDVSGPIASHGVSFPWRWYAYANGFGFGTTSWVDAPGSTISFTLPANADVEFRFDGTVFTNVTSLHCVLDFNIDGSRVGDPTYGSQIIMGSGHSWWAAASRSYVVPNMAAGSHTVKIQARAASGSPTDINECRTDNLGYSRLRLSVTAYPVQ